MPETDFSDDDVIGNWMGGNQRRTKWTFIICRVPLRIFLVCGILFVIYSLNSHLVRHSFTKHLRVVNSV